MSKIKFGPKPSTVDTTYLDTSGTFSAYSNDIKYDIDKNDSSILLEIDDWFFENDLNEFIAFLKAVRKELRKGKSKA